jgi:hypothetical protein
VHLDATRIKDERIGNGIAFESPLALALGHRLGHLVVDGIIDDLQVVRGQSQPLHRILLGSVRDGDDPSGPFEPQTYGGDGQIPFELGFLRRGEQDVVEVVKRGHVRPWS